MHIPLDPTLTGSPLACVEIGGGSIQTVLFSNGGSPELLEGAHRPDGFALACAVPGLVSDGIVQATNLGWHDIDPIDELGLSGPAAIVANDAEAAGLGEAAIRGDLRRLVYMCLGTGVGGAVVKEGMVERGNLFGHNSEGYGHRFGDLPCRCERTGCLETVAAGWSLPDPLTNNDIARIAYHLAAAIDLHPLARTGTVVIGGGIARRYPRLVSDIAAALPLRKVEASRAPGRAKSAAAWGLRYALTGELT